MARNVFEKVLKVSMNKINMSVQIKNTFVCSCECEIYRKSHQLYIKHSYETDNKDKIIYLI